MKKRIIGIFLIFSMVLLMLCFVLSINDIEATAEISNENPKAYVVNGGKILYDFASEKQLDDFDLYKVIGSDPLWIEGKIVTVPTTIEQKIIYPTIYYGNIEISVRIAPLIENYTIDGGIYVNASNVNNNLDGISAYCINVEKAAYANAFILKIHKFNHGYWGSVKEVSNINYNGKYVDLRVSIIDGTMYIFVDNDFVTTYDFNDSSTKYTGGAVGLRSFYCSQTFDDFSIIHESIKVNTLDLDELYARFDQLDPNDWLESDYIELKNSVESSRTQTYSSQRIIDDAVSKLIKIFDGLNKKYTSQELSALADKCKKYSIDDFTTENAYYSMQSLINRIENIDKSDEYKISKIYGYLNYLIDHALED